MELPPHTPDDEHSSGWPGDPEMSPEYIEILRKMTPAQKLRTVSRLWWTARSLALMGLRMRHPDKSEAELAVMVRDVMLYAGD